MNERCEGALEALGYMKKFVEFLGNRPTLRLRILEELIELIDLLLSGSVIDFRQRIERF